MLPLLIESLYLPKKDACTACNPFRLVHAPDEVVHRNLQSIPDSSKVVERRLSGTALEKGHRGLRKAGTFCKFNLIDVAKRACGPEASRKKIGLGC